MRRRLTIARFLAADVIVGVGVFACVTAGWSMRLREGPAAVESAVSAADAVALRYPYELEEATSETYETFALFDPNPIYPNARSDSLGPPPGMPQQVGVPDVAPAPGSVTGATSELAAAATHSGGMRGGAVLLSEAQIASIKRRLKLTPKQQQMWPAVEVALRRLTYPKKSDSARKNGGTIDTYNHDVQELTSAAYPLVMSFSDDQKRELHMLAHVAGLEQLVPKF